MRELVSVIIPAYNAAAHLRACLDSVLAQTYRNTEIIVINDASSDETSSIVSSYIDSRLRVLNNQSNLGLAACVNQAIGISKGIFIARMDSDDIAHPQRLTKQVGYLESNPDVHVLGTAMQGFGHSHYTYHFPAYHHQCKARLLSNVCFGHPTVMFRGAVFESGDFFYKEELKQYSEEYELWCRMVKKFKFANLPDVLLAYRTSPPIVKGEAVRLRRENSLAIRNKFLKDELGVDSPDDFRRHDHIANLDRASGYDQLISWERWLDELAQLNRVRNSFDQSALSEEINHLRMELYYWNTHLGITAWRRASTFSRSVVHQRYSFKLKHFIKSVIKW